MKVLLFQLDGKIPNIALMRIAGVYCIRHEPTGRCYVGSSRNLRKRLTDHQRNLRNGKHENSKLQRAWSKYGAGQFTAHILCYTPAPEQQFKDEQVYIDLLRPYFNISPLAHPAGLSAPGAIKKARAKMIGHVVSPETRRKIADALRGTTFDAERVEQQRISTTKSWKDEEIRGKRIAGAVRSWADPEKRAATSARFKDLWGTAEHKEKVSAGHAASWASKPERADKSSAFAASQWADPQHRERVIQAQRARWSKSLRLKRVTHNGSTLSIKEWASLTGLTVTTIRLRLRRGWPVGACLELPTRSARPEGLSEVGQEPLLEGVEAA